jgi:uncharacterized integral membrane protein (TIGR00697 family)
MLITDPNLEKNRPHKYLSFISMLWLGVFIITNFMAFKTVEILGVTTIVTVLFYPITYIFADVFTEVYGYGRTRKIIWSGLTVLLLVSVMAYVATLYPSTTDFTQNEAFNAVFKISPIMSFAAIIAFIVGEFLNSFILAKLKVKDGGKRMWFRFIGSTFLGQLADSVTYFGVILLLTDGIFNLEIAPKIIGGSVFLCTLYEIIALPITYRICSFLKKAEGLDIYDVKTDFNPLKIS